MSTEPFIGEIKILGFSFAPQGYQTCQGQLMSIAQNTALFSLIGTYYGGDGQTTFGLPNLQGRVPIGQGQVAGLPSYSIGQMGGSSNVTLQSSNLPPHAHTLNNVTVKQKASTANADETSPDGNYPATTATAAYSGNGPTDNTFTGGTMISGSTDATGSGFPIDIMNPYLTLNYSIAIEGIFPSRN